jgi:hypothetical protein
MKSPLEGVSDKAWAKFVSGMMVGAFDQVHADANALGAFRLMPRRLADLGYITDLRQRKSRSTGKTIWTGGFVGGVRAFLESPRLQYAAFEKSMVDYAWKLKSGDIARPAGMSLSGSLAVLHRGGPTALRSKIRPATRALLEKVAGVF